MIFQFSRITQFIFGYEKANISFGKTALKLLKDEQVCFWKLRGRLADPNLFGIET